MATSILASFESMLGLKTFALATGLLYRRFSKLSAKIKYSENIIMASYLDGKALIFRLANYRNNQLINIEVQVLLSINESKLDKISHPFYSLELERSHINMLILSWTIVYPVNEKSHIWGFKRRDLDDGDVESIVLLKSFDNTFPKQYIPKRLANMRKLFGTQNLSR